MEVGRRLPTEAPAAPAAPVIAIPEDADAVEAATIAVFQARRDSVVSISTSARFRDRFSLRLTEQPLGSGSGFFWDDAGHVVTNNHVIEGASAAVVTLADGRSFDARLVGRDPSHDLAVLAIDGGPSRRALPLGESEGARGRQPGAGDRQPVRARLDADHRHRLGARPRPGRGAGRRSAA